MSVLDNSKNIGEMKTGMTNGLIKATNVEKDNSKLSDTSKDYKELTNEIDKFMIRHNNGNSKSNSGVGDVGLYDDLMNGSNIPADNQIDIENRIQEMKRINEAKLKSKGKQVKMIANTSKAKCELIEKYINQRNENLTDLSIISQRTDCSQETSQLQSFCSNQIQDDISSHKEKWMSIPPKKVLYSTYSSNVPEFHFDSGKQNNQGFTPQPHYNSDIPNYGASPLNKENGFISSGNQINKPLLNINCRTYFPQRNLLPQQNQTELTLGNQEKQGLNHQNINSSTTYVNKSTNSNHTICNDYTIVVENVRIC